MLRQAGRKHVEEGKRSNPLVAVLLGVGFGLLLNLGLIFLFSFFFLGRDLAAPGWAQAGSNYLSILGGSYLATRRIGSRGWFWGGGTGLLFVALIVGLGKAFGDLTPQGLLLARALGLAFLAGAVGGIFGVNSAA